jgi:hypothetical protein
MTSAFSRSSLPEQEFYDLTGWVLMRKESAVNQPDWVCNDCGREFGLLYQPEMVTKDTGTMRYSTYHSGTCGVCKEYKAVTEPRDFGYLLDTWENRALIQTIANY